MPIIDKKFSCYLADTFKNAQKLDVNSFSCDPILSLAEICFSSNNSTRILMNINHNFSSREIHKAKKHYKKNGIVGLFNSYFKGVILNQFTDSETERKIIALKSGFPHLSATTASIISCGFGMNLSPEQIYNIYASYGLIRKFKSIEKDIDFKDINRCVAWLAEIIRC